MGFAPQSLVSSAGDKSLPDQAMNVTVVSCDRELYRLCRDILAEVSSQKWTLSIATPEHAPHDSDLYLWDFQDGCMPAGFPKNSATHLFLVNRKDLVRFRAQTETQDNNILLRPVTRATLTAFLSLAVTAHERKLFATTSLRADRDEILQCLMQTNLRLQEYDQDRTAFLARAVHDFRAPLTALSGYCGLLLSEPLGPLTKDQREVVQRMLNSTQRLSRMAAAMFQLSVGRQMKRRPDLESGDVQACLDQALHEIAPFAEDKSISIIADLTPCPPQLFFEPGQIEQVLINILHNACKFTPKAGGIQITGYAYFWERRLTRSTVPLERRKKSVREPNSYRVDICNTGAAIPLEHLDCIFEEYTSYSGGRDRSGGGLGLAICRMIVNEHDGKVWAENTSSGPRISFVLPLRSEAIRATEVNTASRVAMAEAG
jgi:signal transduction histidine kinase